MIVLPLRVFKLKKTKWKSQGQLALMVERALRKFLPQREVVWIPPKPGFFHLEFISINTWLQIFEKFGSIYKPTERNTVVESSTSAWKGYIAQSNRSFRIWMVRKTLLCNSSNLPSTSFTAKLMAGHKALIWIGQDYSTWPSDRIRPPEGVMIGIE